MQSHLSGVSPPYRPPCDTLYFHDWRYIRHGSPNACWKTEAGEGLPLFSPLPPPTMRYEYAYDSKPGLRLKALPPKKSDPVIAPHNSPFPFFLMAGNLMREDGRYRLWLEYWPIENFGEKEAGTRNLLCYAESDNGFDWRFPEQDRLTCDSACAKRAVYGAPSSGVGYHGSGVFKDPSAPPEERYKLIHLGKASGERLERYLRERPDDVPPMALRGDEAHAVFGATSPDGFDWTPIHDPLLLQMIDTHNICEYDAVRKTYVAYIRDWLMGRRTIGRIESPDFRSFPPPEPIFWPGPSVRHHDLWYANGKYVMPDHDENGAYHMMFPMRWDVATDEYDFFLATSPDNVTWDFVPGGPICRPGEPGAWDAGGVWPGREMVYLSEDRMGILYAGVPVPHKHPRHPPYGGLAWALWERDRLVALEAPAEARFSTYPLIVKGRALRINYRAPATGFVRVQVHGGDGEIMQERSFDDCDFLCGNELDRLVTWKGASSLSFKDDEPIFLRVEMRHAELFSMRFV